MISNFAVVVHWSFELPPNLIRPFYLNFLEHLKELLGETPQMVIWRHQVSEMWSSRSSFSIFFTQVRQSQLKVSAPLIVMRESTAVFNSRCHLYTLVADDGVDFALGGRLDRHLPREESGYTAVLPITCWKRILYGSESTSTINKHKKEKWGKATSRLSSPLSFWKMLIEN